MKKLFSVLLCCLTALQVFCAGLDLVKDGKPNAAIILGSNPTRSAQMGALELQYFVKQITGATLPIVTEEASSPVKLYIGDSSAIRAAGMGSDQYSGETYELKTIGDCLYMNGSDTQDFAKVDYSNHMTFPLWIFRTNGSLYAVYEFLEKCCGVVFCGPWENSVSFPRKKTLSVPPIARKFTPGMDSSREIYPDDRSSMNIPFTEREYRLWKLRWRQIDTYGTTNHNCDSIYYKYWGKAKSPVLASQFKQKRPELFAQGYQGRFSHVTSVLRSNFPDDPDLPPQVCFTHPDTMKHFAEEANTYYHGKNVPGGWRNLAGKADPNRTLAPLIPSHSFYYPVEPQDNSWFCQCPECRKMFPELTGDVKTSHLKFYFLSGIARELAKINPKAGIATAAYIQTLPYPYKLQLPPNLAVQICLTHFAWWHPGIRKAQEREYGLWVKNESKKRILTLWTYLFGPHWDGSLHYHYNNFPGLYPWQAGKMMKKFADDGIRGWFSECELQHALLEAYVSARVAFDPDTDVDQTIDTWLKASYGDAAPAMKEIYRICEDAYWNPASYPKKWVENPDKPMGPHGPHNPYWGTGLQSEEVNWGYGLPRFDRIEKLLAQAAKQVKEPWEKAQYERFVKGIWSIARKGRIEYELKKAAMGENRIQSLTCTPVSNASGDPRKIDWTKVVSTGLWKYINNGEDHPKKISLKAACDEQYLYLNYQENSPAGKRGQGVSFWEDCTEIFFSELPCLPLLQIAVSPDGRMEQLKHELVNDAAHVSSIDLKPVFYNHNDGKTWSWQMAIPLKGLPFGKYRTALTVNFFRSLYKQRAAAWAPLYFTEVYKAGIAKFGRLYFSRIEYQKNVLDSIKPVKDEAASNGLAIPMDGNRGWSARWGFGPIEKGKYRVEVWMRTEAKAQDGVITHIGIYDQRAKHVVQSVPVQLKDIAGTQYRKLTMDSVTLSPDVYFYISSFRPKMPAPCRVYVDRFIITKLKR